jgi:hypothetical protein
LEADIVREKTEHEQRVAQVDEEIRQKKEALEQQLTLLRAERAKVEAEAHMRKTAEWLDSEAGSNVTTLLLKIGHIKQTITTLIEDIGPAGPPLPET